jgi:hypothetical protein
MFNSDFINYFIIFIMDLDFKLLLETASYPTVLNPEVFRWVSLLLSFNNIFILAQTLLLGNAKSLLMLNSIR